MNTNNEQQEKAAGFIARILTSLGVPGTWAKLIAGAIMGAIVTWAAMTQTSCASQGQADPPGRAGLTITKGQVVITRDGRVLAWDRETNSLVWSQDQPETDCPPIVQQDK